MVIKMFLKMVLFFLKTEVRLSEDNNSLHKKKEIKAAAAHRATKWREMFGDGGDQTRVQRDESKIKSICGDKPISREFPDISIRNTLRSDVKTASVILNTSVTFGVATKWSLIPVKWWIVKS